MGRLILIRHGETDKNRSKILHDVKDVQSINTTGRKQIHKAAVRLSKLSPFKIYTSTEKRAVESAKILAQKLDIPMEEMDGIQERNFGIFTSKSWDEARKVLDSMALEERYDYVPINGESWRTFETRLEKAIRKIIKENEDKTIIVVTHGGAIKALIPLLLKVSKEESFKHVPGNASLTIFDFDDKGFNHVAINDTSHLRGN